MPILQPTVLEQVKRVIIQIYLITHIQNNKFLVKAMKDLSTLLQTLCLFVVMVTGALCLEQTGIHLCFFSTLMLTLRLESHHQGNPAVTGQPASMCF